MHCEMQLRCRTQSYPVYEHAARNESLDESPLQLRRGEPAVSADGDTPQPTRTHPACIGKAELTRIAEMELSSYDTAKVV